MYVAALTAMLVLRAGPPSELCEVEFVPKLAPGSYAGRFVQVGNAKGGADVANMEVQALVRGELVLHVDEDGVITAASAPRGQWVLLGAGTIESGKVPIVTGMNGFAEGALTMVGPGGDQAVRWPGTSGARPRRSPRSAGTRPAGPARQWVSSRWSFASPTPHGGACHQVSTRQDQAPHPVSVTHAGGGEPGMALSQAPGHGSQSG